MNQGDELRRRARELTQHALDQGAIPDPRRDDDPLGERRRLVQQRHAHRAARLANRAIALGCDRHVIVLAEIHDGHLGQHLWKQLERNPPQPEGETAYITVLDRQEAIEVFLQAVPSVVATLERPDPPSTFPGAIHL